MITSQCEFPPLSYPLLAAAEDFTEIPMNETARAASEFMALDI